MVRFCPRCGGPLLPKGVEGDEYVLECSRCGYRVRVDKREADKYRLKYHVEEEKRITTSKSVESKKTEMTPEQREMLSEYYEIFLESFQEESSED